MNLVKAIIKSLRPHQWVKNVFLYAGVFFAGDFLHLPSLIRATLAFMAFCAISSGVYLINDIVDRKSDRIHPYKKNRPIASGQLKVAYALITALILFIVGIVVSLYIGVGFLYFSAGYIFLQLLYTFFLKKQPILDILTVASGFVIRAAAGGAAVDVPISSWLLLCTSLLALFLVTEKRRQELTRIEKTNESNLSRPLLDEYSIKFLDNLAIIEVSATLVAYSFYVFSNDVFVRFGNHSLGLTLPFVFYGLLRYLWLVHEKEKGESPTRILLTDLPTIINMILWSITVFLIVYFS
ncbi:decaprenyl-phosphate phosphoribosyltransferase [bacterium]|nr:decaprenyl-phosphate phosphoribosyltransferase [bacterium]